MQTFLPYLNIEKSAAVLDEKRCWKQAVEAKQILCVLRASNLPADWKKSKSYIKQKYKNHSAVKMWKGYETTLKHYYNIFLKRCKEELKINTKLVYLEGEFIVNVPWWFGEEKFHRSHRARLIKKNREFYLDKFPGDEGFNNGECFWPVNETKNFRVICKKNSK